jgi:hypothetical protein
MILSYSSHRADSAYNIYVGIDSKIYYRFDSSFMVHNTLRGNQRRTVNRQYYCDTREVVTSVSWCISEHSYVYPTLCLRMSTLKQRR